jgi:hypothetical protein
MHYIKYVLSFILLLALAGCNDDKQVDYEKNNLTSSDLDTAMTYFNQKLIETLTEAKNSKDPFDAYVLLVKAYYGADSNRKPISYTVPSKNIILTQSRFAVSGTIEVPYGDDKFLINLTDRKEALSLLFDSLDSALAQGNKKAFIDLYDSKKSYFENDIQSLKKVEELQIKYAPAFMTMAEVLSVGDPLDDELILLYAYQNNKGFFYTKNSAKSVDYYQKLYPTNKTVALYIIGVYLEINDFENAYFWKVRCIDTCANMYDTLYAPIAKRTKVDDIFRERLNSTQFKEIEKASNDPSRTSYK